MLSLGFAFPLLAAPALKNQVVALAHAVRPVPHTVHLVSNGEDQEIRTESATVGDLLRERMIYPATEDSLAPTPDTPLSEGLVVTYRTAVPVTLIVRGARQELRSSAADVGTLLAQQQVTLGTGDRVVPAADESFSAESVVRVIHTTEWTQRVRERVAPTIERRLSLELAPNRSKVVSRGSGALREKLLLFRRIDDDPHADKVVIESRVVSKGKPRVIVSGIAAYERYAHLAQRGFRGTVKLANAALHMLATAYTANCSGCSGSGLTSIGVRAGHGVVAVDPRVIPLGTRLYITGYGHAIAGDTGGAIRGNRIDLGFDSLDDAMSFGMREVHVYVLR